MFVFARAATYATLGRCDHELARLKPWRQADDS